MRSEVPIGDMGAVVDKLEFAWYEVGVNALRGILQEEKDVSNNYEFN